MVIFQGTARRKKKVVHRTATADDKKLQSSLKKLAVNNIAGIEEVWSLSKLLFGQVAHSQIINHTFKCKISA